VKLVLFADLHLDSPFRWSLPEVGRKRRKALCQTLDAIVDLTLEVDADALCCAGDLYEHEYVTPDTGAVIRKAFARLDPIPVLVAPGNHDWWGPQSLYDRTDWAKNVHIFSDDHLEAFELSPGFVVWGAAHRKPAGTPGFLDKFSVPGGGHDRHVALFHGTLRSGLPFEVEGKQPHAPFDSEQIPNAGMSHALVGHFHTPADGEWHTYPGNPDPLSFGESGERGAVVIEFDDGGEISRSRHVVARTTLADLTVDLTGSSSGHEVRQRVEAELERYSGIVRVTLDGELNPDVDFALADLDGLAPHLEALIPRSGAITAGYDLDLVAAEATVRGEFVRDVRASGLDTDLQRRVLITGLRALAGRKDLEVP
jgi:DNA repair protein SbcD/Mre11